MSITSRITRPVTRRLTSAISQIMGSAFSPRSLFTGSDVGVWYDLDDNMDAKIAWVAANGTGGFLTAFPDHTLFQDSAFTTPVTGVGQPLGGVKDKSGGNRHRTQATAANRPLWGARKNLLLATTTLSTQNVTTTATPYTLSHTGTGTITLSGTSTAGPLVGAGSLTFTPTAGTLTLTVSGTVSDAQLELGSTATRYQRVTTATDYDAAGFPKFATYDGVNDTMATASIDLTGGSTMSTCVGYTNDLIDLFSHLFAFGNGLQGSVPGGAWLHVSDTGSPSLAVQGLGIASAYAGASTFFTNVTGKPYVLSATMNTLGATQLDCVPYIKQQPDNPTWSANGTGIPGSGNFGNHAFTFGRIFSRTYNGKEFQSVIINKILSAPQLAQLESFINSKTGAY